jgi:hypothetical protein
MKKRRRKTDRLKAVSKLAVLAEKGGEFDYVFYEGPLGGQSGALVSVRKGEYEASLKVEGKMLPKGWGYGATETEGSRISQLLISREGAKRKCYGQWEPSELVRSPRHDFDKDPGPVRTLARLVVKYFSK